MTIDRLYRTMWRLKSHCPTDAASMMIERLFELEAYEVAGVRARYTSIFYPTPNTSKKLCQVCLVVHSGRGSVCPDCQQQIDRESEQCAN